MTPSVNTVTSVAIGAPLATLIAWVLSLNDVVVPGEVTAAISAVISAVIGYAAELVQAGRSKE